MDLQPYVDTVRHELGVAAAAGGSEAEALAQRLTAPLESALRLALLEALSEAAEQITREFAPGSVHVRLNGRDPEFTVQPAEADASAPTVVDVPDDGDGGTWRVSLRLPDSADFRVAIGGKAFEIAAILLFERVTLGGIEHGQYLFAVQDLPFGDARLVHRPGFGDCGFLRVGQLLLDDALLGVLPAKAFHRELVRALGPFIHEVMIRDRYMRSMARRSGSDSTRYSNSRRKSSGERPAVFASLASSSGLLKSSRRRRIM